MVSGYLDERQVSFGGFLSGVEFFDAACFGLSDKEAALMDPQQRMLMETCYEALHDSGSIFND